MSGEALTARERAELEATGVEVFDQPDGSVLVAFPSGPLLRLSLATREFTQNVASVDTFYHGECTCGWKGVDCTTWHGARSEADKHAAKEHARPASFSISKADLDRCPKGSLAARHYRLDGRCLCALPLTLSGGLAERIQQHLEGGDADASLALLCEVADAAGISYVLKEDA
jgi:hypothetical protein